MPSSLVVVIPGNPSASTSCAITPVSSPTTVRTGSFFQVNVLPVNDLTLSKAFGITVMLYLKLISDDENAVISPPT